MKFYIIGIDDNNEPYFNSEVQEIIWSHKIFTGGARHFELVKSFLPEDYKWINITVPLNNVFEQYQPHSEIVVFASGDPLFYGFGNTIQKRIPEAEIKLYPFFNSLQILAHKLLLPYHDMKVVSLTGRDWDKFDEALISGYEKIGILTDKNKTPAVIAARMLEYGYDNYKMYVGELLGNKEKEKINIYELEEIEGRVFETPNNIILIKTYSRPRPLGIPDSDFNLLEGRVKMITKMPVRLLSLHMLDLRDKKVFWDIGFCTGSVSIEAKMQFPHLKIYAFEKRKEGEEIIKTNCRKMGIPGISVFTGDFLETDVSELPTPDAVFIGGHGGKMKEIVSKIAGLLNTGGTLVFNSVYEESNISFKVAIERNNFTLSESYKIKVDDFNTIEVLKATKL